MVENSHEYLNRPNIGIRRLEYDKNSYIFNKYIKNVKIFRCHLQLNDSLKVEGDDIYYLEMDGICRLNRFTMQNTKYQHGLNQDDNNLISNFDIHGDLICLVTLLGRLVIIRNTQAHNKVEVVYDLDTNEIHHDQSILNCVQFYHQGTRIITASNDKSIKILDLCKQKVVMKYLNGFANNHISLNNNEDLICLS